MNRLKALLVGVGFMGSYWAMNLRNNGETKLVAWIDVRPEVIAQAADDLVLGDIYTGPDLEKAIVETKPDFVVDTTPPHVHRDVMLQALAADQGADKEILLLWIGLVSHLIHCVEMVSPGRLFQLALLVSFANKILSVSGADALAATRPYQTGSPISLSELRDGGRRE